MGAPFTPLGEHNLRRAYRILRRTVDEATRDVARNGVVEALTWLEHVSPRRICPGCREDFPVIGRREGALYCSDRCMNTDHQRQRRARQRGSR